MASEGFDHWPAAELVSTEMFSSGSRHAVDEWEIAAREGNERNPSVWERFFGYCDGTIVAALSRQPIQAADREDCRQQIWVELVATRMSGFHGGSLSAWLSTLARNKATDIVRRARRHPVAFASEELESVAVDVAQTCSADEAATVVRVALVELEGQVERRTFAVFVLRCLKGLSFGQIAREVQLTALQARARYHRTKAKFRRILLQQKNRSQPAK